MQVGHGIKPQLVGTWKLISMTREKISTGEEIQDLGHGPDGLLNYTTDGHMSLIIVKKDRPRPVNPVATPDEMISLFNTMISYAGTYSLHDKQIIHHIDISWNQAWTGSEQPRFYEFLGNRVTLTTAAYMHPTEGEMKVSSVWEKMI